MLAPVKQLDPLQTVTFGTDAPLKTMDKLQTVTFGTDTPAKTMDKLQDVTYHSEYAATINLSGLTAEAPGMLSMGPSNKIKVVGDENRSTGYQWEVTKNECGAKLNQIDD